VLVHLAALLGLTAGFSLPAAAASPVEYADIPGPAAGDILSVSSVTGPPPGSFWASGLMSQRSDSLESFRAMSFSLLYGLHPRACFGVTASHYLQDRGTGPNGVPINKQGPGDTRVYLKWRAPMTDTGPLYVGLRPGLRVPTGYDRDGPGLLPFTTGTLDFELLALLSFETPRVGVHLNPGISLPGGKWHNELLAGVGFDVRGGLPLGLKLKGEYFTRFDIPAERFRHEIYGSVGHPIPLGLTLEVGFRKRLAENEDTGAMMSLRLGLGPGGGMPAVLITPPRAKPTRILIPPVATTAEDPTGMGPLLRATLVREISQHKGLSASTAGGADYTATLEIVSVQEASGRSLSIPKILVTPRATIEITAAMTLTDGQGSAIIDRVPLNMNLSRGMGMKLLPTRGDEDTWIPTAQTRAALRNKGLRNLARKAAKVVAQVIATEQKESS
jgi:hypothetical protein